jgi:hypothetical protein
MIADYLGYKDAASHIHKAVGDVLRAGNVLTPDLGRRRDNDRDDRGDSDRDDRGRGQDLENLRVLFRGAGGFGIHFTYGEGGAT